MPGKGNFPFFVLLQSSKQGKTEIFILLQIAAPAPVPAD